MKVAESYLNAAAHVGHYNTGKGVKQSACDNEYETIS
jgi:hypothetical protein